MLTPITAVTAGDPYAYYARLVAETPFGYDDTTGMWVAADAAHVREVLGHPDLRVRPAAEPVPRGIVGTPAGEVFGELVRMTDGPRQRRLKDIIVTTLASVTGERVVSVASDVTARVFKELPDASPHAAMFAIPVQVVATLCGLDSSQAAEASRLIADFVQCIPPTATAEQQEAAARAASALRELLDLSQDTGTGLLAMLAGTASRKGWAEPSPLLANGIGLLSQTFDATAGLIGNTLIALSRGDIPPVSPEEAVPASLIQAIAEVARHDAPIQNTRRFTVMPTRIGDEEIPAGQAVLVLLAAANRDPAANPDPHAFRPDRTSPAMFTFGLGHHRCPGQAIAIGIAAAVVSELARHDRQSVRAASPNGFLPLANARIPVL